MRRENGYPEEEKEEEEYSQAKPQNSVEETE